MKSKTVLLVSCFMYYKTLCTMDKMPVNQIIFEVEKVIPDPRTGFHTSCQPYPVEGVLHLDIAVEKHRRTEGF